MLKIVNVYQSDTYKNDTRFTSEESKKEYYAGNFWADNHHIVKQKMFIRLARVGDEIIVLSTDEDKLTAQDRKELTLFFMAKDPATEGFIALDPSCDKKRVMEADLVVVMEGVKGWWILRK